MFSSNQPLPFPTFIDQVKSGTEDVIKALKLDENTFLTVPHKYILDNPSDVAIGVTKVKIKNGLSLFKIFDTTLIKYVDDGEIIYIIYTITTDYKSIEQFAATLFEKLGDGCYDSDKDYTFRDVRRIKDLATNSQEEDKSILNVWLTDKYSVVLQYVTNPRHQLALRITKTVPKQIDRTSRKGTIHELLQIDLNNILLQEDEISMETSYLEDGSINCIDYKYHLKEKVMNAFDTITIRLFSHAKAFTLKTQTHLTFTISKDIPLKTKLQVCESIQKIYGSDWNGYSDLDIEEVDILEKNEYWSGRHWHLNEVHGLYCSGDTTENVYWVELTNSTDESGLTLHIGCYNKLLEYFTVD